MGVVGAGQGVQPSCFDEAPDTAGDVAEVHVAGGDLAGEVIAGVVVAGQSV